MFNTALLSGHGSVTNVLGDHNTHYNIEIPLSEERSKKEKEDWKEHGQKIGAFSPNAWLINANKNADKRVQRWLAAPDISQNYNAARLEHLTGTGSWLIDGTDYTQWRDSRNSVLCIYGSRESTS